MGCLLVALIAAAIAELLAIPFAGWRTRRLFGKTMAWPLIMSYLISVAAGVPLGFGLAFGGLALGGMLGSGTDVGCLLLPVGAVVGLIGAGFVGVYLGVWIGSKLHDASSGRE